MVKRKASDGKHGSQSSSVEPALRKVKERKKAYELADPLPEGQVMKDLSGNMWKLGKAFATGGFGLIYEATNENNSYSNDTSYVIKLEPQSNGPLFCEMHFYQRVCKPEIIRNWMSVKRMKTLGIPTYIGSGCLEKKGKRYRFMVMERFGTDIHKVFEQHGRHFSPKTVFTIALKLVDALEFIHENEYVHADIKGSNLLLGLKKGHKDDVYLVDFGLAYRFTCDGKHREYFEDKRRQHDGTIEYTSRDAHRGVMPSRRGDMEILGYCLLQWLAGKLPWESNLKDPIFVRDQKFKYMKNIQSLMKVCFPKGGGPVHLAQYLIYVDKLSYTDKPDYDHIRSIFTTALKDLGLRVDGRLDLTAGESPSPLPIRPKASASSRGNPVKQPPQRRPNASLSPLSPPPVKMPRTVNQPRNTPGPSPCNGVGANSAKKRTAAKKGLAVRRPHPSPSSVSESPKPIKMPRAMKPPKTTPVTVSTHTSGAKAKSPLSRTPASPKLAVLRKRKAAVTSVAVQTSPGLKGLRKRHKPGPACRRKPNAT